MIYLLLLGFYLHLSIEFTSIDQYLVMGELSLDGEYKSNKRSTANDYQSKRNGAKA